MPQGPKRLEVPTVDDLAIEREIVLVIRLREDISVSVACNCNGSLIGLR